MKNICTSPEVEEIKSKIAKSFSGLSFDEESHTYMLNGSVLTNTTTYLKRFSDSFNSYYASEAKGAKMMRQNPDDKRTGQYYRARWNHIRNEASAAGTRIHLFSECYPHFDAPIDWREEAILEFYEWLPEHYKVLFLELRVYDEATLHAGTVDGLLYNTKTGKLVIFDWKTNGRNINELYKNKNLKGVFSGLKATPLNKFSIQLSDYANMIQTNTEFEVEERWVVWIRKDPMNVVDTDRNDDYAIAKVKCDLDKSNFKLFKVKDYTQIIQTSYVEAFNELKAASVPAGVSKGLFAKTKTDTKPKKKKSLFSKK